MFCTLKSFAYKISVEKKYKEPEI